MEWLLYKPKSLLRVEILKYTWILKEINILEYFKELHYNHSTIWLAILKKDFLNKWQTSVQTLFEEHTFQTSQD